MEKKGRQMIIAYYGKECYEGEGHTERTERNMKRTERTSEAEGPSGQRHGVQKVGSCL